MNKKTRLIPFDWDRYKAGATAVCRNPRYEIQFIAADSLGITVVYFHKNCYKPASLELNGIYIEGEESDYDLFLKEEIEEKTFYINIYSDSKLGYLHESVREAEIRHNDGWLGILKVTYTEEDLIK